MRIRSGRRKKLGHMVEFPMDGLDLKPFLDVKAGTVALFGYAVHAQTRLTCEYLQ